MPLHQCDGDVGEFDVGVLRDTAQHGEGLLVADVVVRHEHADCFADFAVASQPAAKRSCVLAVGHGVSGDPGERAQQDGPLHGRGVEAGGLVGKQIQRTDLVVTETPSWRVRVFR